MEGSEPSTPGLVSLTDLNVLLLTNKRSYVLGEPVFLRAVVANRSPAHTFRLQGRWRAADDFEIRVARARGMPARYLGGEESGRPATTMLLPPREVRVHRWTLCYEPANESGYLFDQPGEYTIECSARGFLVNNTLQDLRFSQAPIRIEVREQTPEQKRVFARIAKPEFAEDLQNIQDGRVRSDTATVWEQLVRADPDSLWAPYGRMLLAWREWQTGERDSKAVVQRLQAILDEYPDFPLRDTVYYATAAGNDRLGEPLQALEWLWRLRREYPTSPHLRVDNVLFRKYLYRDGWEGAYVPWYLRQ